MRVLCAFAFCALIASAASAEEYVSCEVEGRAIERPLSRVRGDASRGRALVIARDKGNCLACHLLPIPEESDHGTLAPPLIGVGARLTPGELRLRLVDEKVVNPDTIMPAFYRDPRLLYRPRPDAERTILTAQEIEDVIAYLASLR